MDCSEKTVTETLRLLSTDMNFGLTEKAVQSNLSKYGENKLTEKKRKTLIARITTVLKEPMILILLFSLIIAFGANFGKFLKTGEGDFVECIGILSAVALSVSITLIMEGSSEKAFATLNKVYDNLSVRVIREGKPQVVSQREITVGDIILLDSGDKIVADGRLIESNCLTVDESALTGESVPVKKDANAVLNGRLPLAERVNCVYSGTFVASGNGKMVVTVTGDKTEIGAIAEELSDKGTENTPLQNKLARLGKTVSVIGVVSAVSVFVLSVIKLWTVGNLNFDSVRELFISCIILIVAAVPEGLPTIVAVSLALNMIKLAKENALIKKMTATETAGAISVICSDKTGTLTQNKMEVREFVSSGIKGTKKRLPDYVLQNFICNSTAEKAYKDKKIFYKGSGTECAVMRFAEKNGIDTVKYRNGYSVIDREPFSSEKKYMITTIVADGTNRKLIKGAPEKIIPHCNLTERQKFCINGEIGKFQKKAGRVICFAHIDCEEEGKSKTGEKYVYDGFAVLGDPVRPEVGKAVKDCKKAGVKIKILTGDNKLTAFAVAKELGIAESETEVINATDLEGLSEEDFAKAIKNVTVIARSTPIVKLKVVTALKKQGEVVAVTGDGINDAPAIKKADVGISMGLTGSEITKEAADVVLLDDSFATVVKAVSFGRNVYKNIQRFITFQLTVNLSALLFITVTAILGLESPFNTLQLLWINVIMDGPPALTLGLEKPSGKLMNLKPVKRSSGIIGTKTVLRIVLNAVIIGVIMITQYLANFMSVSEQEKGSAVFTLFILFQLFNAFNCRELGSTSIFKGVGRNKIMVATFAVVFVVHIVIVQFLPFIFGVSPMSFGTWVKCVSTSFSIIAVTEVIKAVYRFADKKKIIFTGYGIKERINSGSL